MHVRVGTIAVSVLVFLGIPLVAGFLTRTLGERTRAGSGTRTGSCPGSGRSRSTGCCSPSSCCSPSRATPSPPGPLDVARIALPLLAYFAAHVRRFLRPRHRAAASATPRPTTLAFTAAGNNFELAIAVAIGVFGVTSGQALAGVVGPLIEVPVLVALVYVALWLRRRYYPTDTATG